jgi:hypothetical protein
MTTAGLTRFTVVAALFLATGTVHAYDKYSAPVQNRYNENGEIVRPEIDAEFNCDRLPKYYLGGHFSQQYTTKDVTLNFEVGFSNNRERYLPGDEIVIRYNMKTGKLWINDNRCKWSE